MAGVVIKSACEMSGLQLPPCFYFFVFQFLRFLFCTTDETVKFLFNDLKTVRDDGEPLFYYC